MLTLTMLMSSLKQCSWPFWISMEQHFSPDPAHSPSNISHPGPAEPSSEGELNAEWHVDRPLPSSLCAVKLRVDSYNSEVTVTAHGNPHTVTLGCLKRAVDEERHLRRRERKFYIAPWVLLPSSWIWTWKVMAPQPTPTHSPALCSSSCISFSLPPLLQPSFIFPPPSPSSSIPPPQ